MKPTPQNQGSQWSMRMPPPSCWGYDPPTYQYQGDFGLDRNIWAACYDATSVEPPIPFVGSNSFVKQEETYQETGSTQLRLPGT